MYAIVGHILGLILVKNMFFAVFVVILTKLCCCLPVPASASCLAEILKLSLAKIGHGADPTAAVKVDEHYHESDYLVTVDNREQNVY